MQAGGVLACLQHQAVVPGPPHLACRAAMHACMKGGHGLTGRGRAPASSSLVCPPPSAPPPTPTPPPRNPPWIVRQGHEGAAQAVCFSPCGGYVVSGAADDAVKVFDVNSQECLATLEVR